MEDNLAEEARFLGQIESYVNTAETRATEFRTQVDALIGDGMGATDTRVPDLDRKLPRPEKTAPKRPRGRSDDTDSARLRRLAEKALRRVGRPMSGTDVLAEIMAEGHTFSSKNPAELLKKSLKDDVFINLKGRGYWLAEIDPPTIPKLNLTTDS